MIIKNPIAFLILMCGILLILNSCESMISDVEVPESEPKLVITGFLLANADSITITVKKSRPLYVPTPGWDNSFPAVNNATVIISDGLNSISLPFNSHNGTYQVSTLNMPLVTGKTYSIGVTTPDGYKATSVCTIPSGIVPDVELTGIDTINQYGSISLRASLRFRDLPGKGHYYRIGAGTQYGYEYSYYNYFYETGFERGEPFISDKNKDGELFTFRTWEINKDNLMDNKLYVSLLITDENYYNFHRSINASSDGDNPFSEPTPVFTNIKGGLGIFSGVNGKLTTYFLNGSNQHRQ